MIDLGSVLMCTAQCGLAAVGFGFVAFFISYALRVWIRYSVRRSAGRDPE